MGRVRKDVTGQPSTEYYYFGSQVMAEKNVSTGAWTNYVFFGGDRIARREYPAGDVFYYFSDHLKTTSAVRDSAGNPRAESDYYPWGGELQFVNNDTNHYKFTGKERDAETQLDYFGARYYSNGLGRWVSADWSASPVPVPYADLGDPQSLNLYGYVGGNPASKADPDGHCPICIPIVVDIVVDLTVGEVATAAGAGAVLGAGAGVAQNNPSSLSQPVMEPGAYAFGRYLAKQVDPKFEPTRMPNELRPSNGTGQSNGSGQGNTSNGQSNAQSSGNLPKPPAFVQLGVWRIHMVSREDRQKALNEIREHIAEHGFHTYVVTGGGYPHFGYTIGLTESLGAELILPGTSFYRLDDVSKVIKSIIGKLSPPVAWDTVSVDADSWGSFAFPTCAYELGNRPHAWRLRLLSGKKCGSLPDRARRIALDN
jgi:RHS repeat-associated protein